MPEVNGDVAPGYEAVADTFAATFATDYAELKTGGALSVYLHGAKIIDLWGGLADARTARPWAEDTPAVVFSSTKGVLALLVARLVQEGKLDYEARVADYWPEFAQAGKGDVLVRQLLSHQAGLSTTRRSLTFDEALDWDLVTAELAAQEPFWAPGQGHIYHALTFGWLAGELIRRVSGQPVGEYLRTLVTGPLDADFWIGAPAEAIDRVAFVQAQDDPNGPHIIPPEGDDWPERGITLGGAFPYQLVTPDGGFNDPRVQAGLVAGANGVGTARALAEIWSAAVVDTAGVQHLLDPAVIAEATAVQSQGPTRVPGPGPHHRWGMGFMLDSGARPILGPRSFGHDGAGGQVAFADPDAGLGFAYVTNYMPMTLFDRGTSIVDALRGALRQNGVLGS